MDILKTRADLVAVRKTLSGSIGLVPTMGALHAGHMALVQSARAACDHVIVSIFVNPLQFGNPEDLETYPDTMAQDLALLAEAGVDFVFAPSPDEMYGHARDTFVETPRLAGMLMGALRPGHFRGVATVVTKLFNLIRPDFAWFGEKDFQQVQVVRQMVNDLEMGVEIMAHPTVREADGLAMSSRNLRLTPQDRAAAVVLHQGLLHGQRLAQAGAAPRRIRREVRGMIQAVPLAQLETLDLRDAETLMPIPDRRLQRPAVLLLAATFGKVLLIDNAVLQPPP